ncbi:MAG: hypothetical protein COA78_29470, partial [Blastopirellula sp.]
MVIVRHKQSKNKSREASKPLRGFASHLLGVFAPSRENLFFEMMNMIYKIKSEIQSSVFSVPLCLK